MRSIQLHPFSLLAYGVTRSRCRWLKSRFIRWFARRYRIDMSLAAVPDLDSYEHFNAFFTRALRPGSRSISSDPNHILSPAEGVISEIGDIRARRLLQAKDRWFTVQELLGGEAERPSLRYYSAP